MNDLGHLASLAHKKEKLREEKNLSKKGIRNKMECFG